MVKEGTEFEVQDARTGEDITRSVLTQIIFEEENRGGGQNLLPIQFLRQLISFYGNSMQAFLPSYLEMSLESFAKQQERLRGQLSNLAPGKMPGMGVYEDQIRQNMALFDRAMKMFSPFGNPMNPMNAWTGQNKETPNPFAAAAAAFGAGGKSQGAESAASPQREDEIRDLKDQLAAMRQQIADLAQRK